MAEKKTDTPPVQGEKQEQAERENVITLKTPYRFEGKEYPEIDLSGLGSLTVQDAVDTQRQLFGPEEAATATICETTTAFARMIAAKATGLPIEFFKLMPRSVSRRVVRTVQAFLNVESRTENHIMRLAKPYFYKGQEYTEVDLNNLANLNSMNESEAENRIARAGFMITETSFNYLYACVLASMATGLPEDFFTGLPLNETLKLKNAVNDGDFFE